MMAGKLQDQVVLITGGGSGIGRASAALLAREGAQVVITGRDVERGQAAEAALRTDGGRVTFRPCDVRDASACDAAAAWVLDTYGRIDVLFNNAGIVPFGTVIETTTEVWRDVWETNVSGTFYMSRAVLPGMIARGRGVIVNNASDWGIVGGQGAAAYCTTKGAVIQLTRCMALDHARQGIRVNAVCPGDTVVERWRERRASDEDFARFLADAGDDIPMGRVGIADEIARGVLFLACDDSSYMTGQTLVIDGGNTSGGASGRY